MIHKLSAMGLVLLMLFISPIFSMGESLDTFRYAEVVTPKGTLNMRAQPKDNAKIVSRLSKGAIVRVLGEEGAWTNVLHAGESGYVMSSFLEEISELPYHLITSEEKGDAVIAFKRALHKLGYLKSDDINTRFDAALENALTRLQLLNGVTLSPTAITPELQALMEWGMLEKGKSGYIDTVTDADSGLMVSVFCWDSDGTLYDADRAVKLEISFAAQASGGQPPYAITVKKSLSPGGPESADEVSSPFSHIWGQNSDRLYLYATATDAAGNTVTACAPFSYTLPERYRD